MTSSCSALLQAPRYAANIASNTIFGESLLCPKNVSPGLGAANLAPWTWIRGLDSPQSTTVRHIATNNTPSGLVPMKPQISYDEFAKLDLRVATVLEARPHPNADKLLLLKIDVGDQQKQIVAGIRGHYEPEQLVDRQIVVINNLEEVVLRGEESAGMLLAASDGDRVVVLQPESRCQPGAAIK